MRKEMKKYNIFLFIGNVFKGIGIVMAIIGVFLGILVHTTVIFSLTLSFTVFGVCFVLVGHAMKRPELARIAEFERLKRDGKQIWGIVNEIYSDYKIQINGIPNTILIVKTTNDKREFISHSFHTKNPYFFKNKKIPIYIDIEDSDKYFVDVFS